MGRRETGKGRGKKGKEQVTTNRLVEAGNEERAQTYWGHDLDLTRSYNVINHVTKWHMANRTVTCSMTSLDIKISRSCPNRFWAFAPALPLPNGL